MFKEILIENYFKTVGLDVSYNTLGFSEDMRNAYVHEHQSDVEEAGGQSNPIKYHLYSKYFEFKNREKYTGFEFFKKQDVEYRAEMIERVKTPQFAPAVVTPKDKAPSQSYAELLTDHCKTLDGALLYLSGGLDSEFVANVMLKNGVKFTPVIFRWTDKTGIVRNDFDTQYAFAFCEAHGLEPIVEAIDIETLWQSEDFKLLSEAIEMISPQMTTYAYMVTMMENKYPNAKHVLGGEVKFQTDFIDDDGTVKNLVFLAKLTPGYNGITYGLALSAVTDGTAQTATLRYSNAGTWTVSLTGPGLSSGTPTNGSWTNTPGSSYEYRVNSVTPGLVFDATYSPSVAQTAWTAINSTSVTICNAATNTGAINADCEVTFGIQVRAVATPATILSSSIGFSLAKAA